MNEPFLIAVSYQGSAYEFKARFERWGYSHRIAVLIEEVTFNFEPDEEGGYRALIGPDQSSTGHQANIPLLQKVAEKLAQLSDNERRD
jgi:hypothetical protein